jgi:hypothetical protein
MSQSVRDFERSREAGETLEDKEFYFVQLDANGKLEVAEGATDLVVGILQAGAPAGSPATYRFGGTAKLILGGTVTSAGQWVTTDSDGKGVVTTTDGDLACRALEAGVAGDIIEVQLPLITLFIA